MRSKYTVVSPARHPIQTSLWATSVTRPGRKRRVRRCRSPLSLRRSRRGPARPRHRRLVLSLLEQVLWRKSRVDGSQGVGLAVADSALKTSAIVEDPHESKEHDRSGH